MKSRPSRKQPLRAPYDSGAQLPTSGAAWWAVIASTVAVGVLLVGLGALMVGLPGAQSVLYETPVPDGSWQLEWSRVMLPPSVEQNAQVGALRLGATGAATLVALLCLLLVAGLWRQRLRVRRDEYYVYWAVGASRVQMAARLLGEARGWGGAALVLSLAATAAALALVERTFPGEVVVSPNLSALAITIVGLGTVLLRWESRAGAPLRSSVSTRLWEIFSAPPIVGAVGFAALSGVGLLAVHPPFGKGGDIPDGMLVLSASLTPIPSAFRGEEIRAWNARTRQAGVEAGFASAGVSRGAGHTETSVVECGNCFEGLMPAPLKFVRVEVHAVAPDTFVHMGLAVTEGRDFELDRDVGVPSVAIVSQALANRHFENGDPIGKRVRMGDSDWMTVVGVVPDRDDIRNAFEYAIYVPLAQVNPAEIEVLVPAGEGGMGGVLDAAPAGAVIGRPRSGAEVFAAHAWFRALLNTVGAATLLLVGVGLWASSRTEASAMGYEIAVRRAVGATRGAVWCYFASYILRRLVIMLAAGAWLSLFLGATLSEAYASTPNLDWTMWVAAGSWVGTLYVLASWQPFRRAARMPLVSGMDLAA